MKGRWNFYSSNELKPKGWLLRQLRIQADGLSGNLDKVWADVRDSAWIGGPAEGWERVPYWLDGFIPLAYLLENEDMSVSEIASSVGLDARNFSRLFKKKTGMTPTEYRSSVIYPSE